jgi:acetyl-CoA carboxylase carboxyltransferase component
MAATIDAEEVILRAGGGAEGQARQRNLGRLPVRERLEQLLDPGTPFFETGLWAAWKLYPEWGDVPAAGLVAGIGTISGQPCVVAANDATVKAGAMFPQSVKKLIRVQKLAHRLRLPVVYLVDSAGVFLPLQDEIFPDEDDFGRIFRNNSVLSAEGIPQFAAVMGNCIAGGAYLPVLCDKLLMTDGSQLCLAGAALVKAAVGQVVDPAELGGAAMHAAVSGTVDFHEKDDEACLERLRTLVGMLPQRVVVVAEAKAPSRDPEDLFDLVPADGRGEYEIRDVLACIVDAESFVEFRPEYGQTLVTGYARIGGHPAGIVANARRRATDSKGEVQIGGVLYGDAAEKAARFVDDCEQTRVPLVFLQDVQGFMVGKQAEQSGIIRSGAKLVRSMSTATVPKFTVIIGSSYGAGHYAMCGRAYDPALILAWPTARYAVMGGTQAAETLLSLRLRDAERAGTKLSDADVAELRESIRKTYQDQTDIRYAAARGWVDAIIRPPDTRAWLAAALAVIRPSDLVRQRPMERDV